MKKVDELQPGDYIAFPFSYDGIEPEEIMVSKITFKNENDYTTHFLYGYRSVSEDISKSDILAIGNLESGKTKLIGWGGKFDVIQPEHPLVIENQKELT